MEKARKSLGQHWLTDSQALEAIAEAAQIKKSDTILEIGPGLGHLTDYLVSQANHVLAVELDEKLAKKLAGKYTKDKFTLHLGNILKFDLTQLPSAYKVVANIPYYLTSKLMQVLSESSNPPKIMVLLVQKEVAQRITAQPGNLSILAVSVQLYYKTELGLVVPSKMFQPPPKVDSQVVILHRHAKPLFHDLDTKKFFRIVKAGFSEKRKKLKSSLAGGLKMSREETDILIKSAGIDPNLRAQELSLKQWHSLYRVRG